MRTEDPEETAIEKDVRPRERPAPVAVTPLTPRSASASHHLGPLHTHAVWRGVIKCSDRPRYLALRFHDIPSTSAKGSGVARVSDHGSRVEVDLDFTFTVPHAPHVMLGKDTVVRLDFGDAGGAYGFIKAELPELTLTGLEPVAGHLLTPRPLVRRLSQSPSPRCTTPSSPPMLSCSLPSSFLRRPSIPSPVSWAAVVRGVEAVPEPVFEDDEPERGPAKPSGLPGLVTTVSPQPIRIPTATPPDVFDEGEFPAPASPPLRPNRRRGVSCGPASHHGFAAPVTLPRPRPPICGSRWSQARLVAGEAVDLRYYGAHADGDGWHAAPAYAARTLASASYAIL